jgi:hypothetical protein
MKMKHSEVPNALLTVLQSSVKRNYIKYNAEVPQYHYSHNECNRAADFPCMY